MDFLGFIGSSELLVCAIVTLIVFGPNRLPELARHLAKLTKIFREASRELHRQIDFHEIERELNRPPKPKAVVTSPKNTDNKTYPYSGEDEGAYYNQIGKDGGYDGYPENQDTVAKKTNTSETVAETKAEDAAVSANHTNRMVIDEDIKIQDAARFQREAME